MTQWIYCSRIELSSVDVNAFIDFDFWLDIKKVSIALTLININYSFYYLLGKLFDMFVEMEITGFQLVEWSHSNCNIWLTCKTVTADKILETMCFNGVYLQPFTTRSYRIDKAVVHSGIHFDNGLLLQYTVAKNRLFSSETTHTSISRRMNLRWHISSTMDGFKWIFHPCWGARWFDHIWLCTF